MVSGNFRPCSVTVWQEVKQGQRERRERARISADICSLDSMGHFSLGTFSYAKRLPGLETHSKYLYQLRHLLHRYN